MGEPSPGQPPKIAQSVGMEIRTVDIGACGFVNKAVKKGWRMQAERSV